MKHLEKLYALIFNTATYGIAVSDHQHNLLTVNKYFCKTTGYCEEELEGQSVFNFFPQKIQPKVAAMYHDVAKGIAHSERVIKIFNNASSLQGTPTPLTTFADSAMTSGREIALDEARQILYVANNVDSTILVYNFPLGRSGLTSAFKTLKLSGQPWGIHFDKDNNRLFVLLDLGAKTIEVYDNPANLDSGKVVPDRSFKIAGSTRLHGITYSSKTDMLIVTEIAAAAAPAGADFASDGGIYIFEKAKDIIDGSQMEVTPTRTIKGANTLLGNPVDVAFDDRAGKKLIYIAEKANKKILVFNVMDSGNVAPKITASTTESPEAIYLDNR